MPAMFTIKLGDRDTPVSVSMLTRTLENALAILRSLESELAPAGTGLQWVVLKASTRSPLTITIAPRPDGKPVAKIGRTIVSTALRGIQEIETAPTLPPHFTDETIEATRKMLSAAEKEGAPLTFATDSKHQVKPSARAAEHIREIIAKARTCLDHGTIEGKLEIVSVHGHKSVFVFETLTDYKVECITTKDDQFGDAIGLLGKRVAVAGLVRYRNHKPLSVDVESIERMPEMSELPQPPDMAPIKITEGIPSEEHVRRMRDAR